ncbi:hypothetical protein CANCADRAFT_43314 [Tortispora caseinolytica NRRL Y-17796]|uniref:Uncharacterized protein n=1 Tax=Tortispora caseinolytica NRRL Y-17796 TaxID=767744 RepID=A0A1E4TLU3_9ASCO|nr:hypothetical protein CANCADRAFT_43314 [Tortispora caseinolytica NRRL Y-17796]
MSEHSAETAIPSPNLNTGSVNQKGNESLIMLSNLAISQGNHTEGHDIRPYNNYKEHSHDQSTQQAHPPCWDHYGRQAGSPESQQTLNPSNEDTNDKELKGGQDSHSHSSDASPEMFSSSRTAASHSPEHISQNCTGQQSAPNHANFLANRYAPMMYMPQAYTANMHFASELHAKAAWPMYYQSYTAHSNGQPQPPPHVSASTGPSHTAQYPQYNASPYWHPGSAMPIPANHCYMHSNSPAFTTPAYTPMYVGASNTSANVVAENQYSGADASSHYGKTTQARVSKYAKPSYDVRGYESKKTKAKFNHKFTAEEAFAEFSASAAENLKKVVGELNTEEKFALNPSTGYGGNTHSDGTDAICFAEVAYGCSQPLNEVEKWAKSTLSRELDCQEWIQDVVRQRAELSGKESSPLKRLNQWLKWWWTDVAARRTDLDDRNAWGRKTNLSLSWQSKYGVTDSVVHARLRQCRRVWKLQNAFGWPTLVLAAFAEVVPGESSRQRKSHLERLNGNDFLI